MKPLVRIFALTLLSGLTWAGAMPAHADRGPHGYRGVPGHHHAYHGRHSHPGHHIRSRGGVWGPLIVGGLIGAALVGASSAHAQPQATVLVPVVPPASSHLVTAPAAPALVVLPPQPLPLRAQYFCAPYRAYYPVATSCPEPWYVITQ
ncbi:MAG: hypothetical protein FJY26_03230 [Betaproteobacteria bacterium]|nr:hypothetical protein [Betaproteobacteria bacterium]